MTQSAKSKEGWMRRAEGSFVGAELSMVQQEQFLRIVV